MIDTQYISYKDPDARVVEKEGAYYRYIYQSYKEEYDHLMRSGLYLHLVEKGLIVSHEEVEIDINDPEIYKLLFPQQINFLSYPFEWSFSQWRKAMLAFLAINQIALKYGMILKDATPYNYYLTKGKAVLFDTTSFVFFKENDLWFAYKQFCEEFLSPIALMKFHGQRWARLYRSHLRGLPLDFVSKQLGCKSWFNLTCLFHIHLHSRYNNKSASNKRVQKTKTGFSVAKISHLLTMIQSTVKSWESAYQYNSHWSSYYEKDIESKEYLRDKEKTVKKWLELTNPKTVIDLGANTGRFSLIASKYAEQVVALEYDDICVDYIEKTIQKESISNLTALIGDLAEMTPGLGILNKELKSLYERGKSEMVLGLALVHHLCISKNLSILHIVELIANISSKYAIVEFIPKEDGKVQLLLQNRKDIFDKYKEDYFVKYLSRYFDIVKEKSLECSKRKLFLCEKK